MTPSNGERGTALVETVLVAPTLILMLIGFVEFGRYADFSIKVANAARAGVQYGAQNIATASDNTGMTSAAKADAPSITGLTVTPSSFCTCSDGSADAGCVVATCTVHRDVYAQVNTSATLSSLFNYSGLPAALRSITVSGSAIMRVEE